MSRPATYEQRVDRALDQYMSASKAPDPSGVRVRTLAHLARVSSATMSNWMQEYRARQGTHATRYVVGCQGYGRAARWQILARPGADRKAEQRARKAQTVYVTRDMATRHARDIVREIKPGLRGQAFDAAIEMVVPLVEDQLAAIVRHVERTLNGTAKAPTP